MFLWHHCQQLTRQDQHSCTVIYNLLELLVKCVEKNSWTLSQRSSWASQCAFGSPPNTTLLPTAPWNPEGQKGIWGNSKKCPALGYVTSWKDSLPCFLSVAAACSAKTKLFQLRSSSDAANRNWQLARSIGNNAALLFSDEGSGKQSRMSGIPESVILKFSIIGGSTGIRRSLYFKGMTVFPQQAFMQTVAEIPGRKDDIAKARPPLWEIDRMPIPGPLTWTENHYNVNISSSEQLKCDQT